MMMMNDDDETKMFRIFFFRNELQVKKNCRILEKNAGKIVNGKKSNFKFQNRGYFGKINIPQNS